MYDSTSLNKINLTKEGIMINYGTILQTKITVDILLKDTSLKISFYDDMNIYNVTKQSLHKFTFLRGFGSDKIIGILPLDSDWYLCWQPD
jgi:hypothetical protein